MPALVVHSNPANEHVTLLLKLLQKLGLQPSVVPDFEAAKKRLERERGSTAVVLVPDVDGDVQLVNAAIAYIEGEAHGPLVIYITDTMAAATYKRLVKSERGDWVNWQSAAREIPELISARASQNISEASAKIVSFLPSKGGVGNTTVAREVGVSLAASRKRERTKVAVVDLNFQSSTLADSLDLEPRLNVSEIMGRPERLDDQLLDIFTSSFSPSLDVFSSPTRFVRGEDMNPQVVFSLLDGLAKRYGTILIDIPHQWFPWVDNVLQGSDGVVITGESTVPAIKQLATRVQHVEQLSIPPDRVMICVNNCEVGFLGRIPRKGHIDRTFAGRQVVYVPRDAAIAAHAANTGKPLVELGPRRSISKSIGRLSGWVRSVTGAGRRISS